MTFGHFIVMAPKLSRNYIFTLFLFLKYSQLMAVITYNSSYAVAPLEATSWGDNEMFKKEKHQAHNKVYDLRMNNKCLKYQNKYRSCLKYIQMRLIRL